jgi:hypothetical protein
MMPMYFPDLKSVQKTAKDMAAHKSEKKYRGMQPRSEEDLPQAREDLARYMIEAWDDTVFAAEIFYAATPENYSQIVMMSIGLKQRLSPTLPHSREARP